MTVDDWRVKYEILNAEAEKLRVEVARLREDAARNRWCEEMKADVKFSLVSTRWHVSWVINGDYFAVNHTDRNAAIDAAMKGGK